MAYSQTTRLFIVCCWMKSATGHSQFRTDHLPSTPPSLPTTYRSPSLTDHIPTTCRPRTDHIPTAYRPHTCNTDLIPTAFTDHILTDQLVHCYPLCFRSVGSAQTRPGGAACDRWGSCHLASFGHESAGTLRGVPVRRRLWTGEESDNL